MDTSKLKTFAQNARRDLIEQVKLKVDSVLLPDSAARRESPKAVASLEAEIKKLGVEQVTENAAYTWFNRFCALRFMDVNRYNRIAIVSAIEGQSQPEILAEAKMGHVDEDDIDAATTTKVNELLGGKLPSTDPQTEAYRALLVASCNSLHRLMPFLFARIEDYTELLLPDDLLSDNAVLTQACSVLTPENCQNVEVIGWLYQFYISEKKDDVFAALKKGKKITPENIPAATQLFTPHWIVRYLVENSLGRLWMLNNPDSRLVEQMDYYIRPEEPATEFLQISSPEEIKICDPACGSGHMLTYAFDLLYAIYEEQGYQATDIPRLIVTRNLYGIEIDQRAGALAAFALTMKAREKYRRFLTSDKVVQPNICVLENIKFDNDELSSYMDQVGRDLLTQQLEDTLKQWEEADNFGSLIRPLVTDVSEVLELLRERHMAEDLFLADVHQKVLTALRQADYLSPKYHVVVANPPYIGGRNMFPRLKEFLADEYEAYKSDVFSAFIVRNTELCLERGQLGYMSPYVWMFISSYEDLRRFLLNTKSITSLIQLEYSGFDGATVPICTFTVENGRSTRIGSYIKLSAFRGADAQSPKTLEAIQNPNCGWFYRFDRDEFSKIPGSPLAFWVSLNEADLYSQNELLRDVCSPRKGLDTGENVVFLRLWHEVARDQSCLDNTDHARKWFPYNKGGEYRRWYGNRQYVINWANDGAEIKSRLDWTSKKPTFRNSDYYFKEGYSWTTVSSGGFSSRYCPEGALFDNGGCTFFAEHSLALVGAFSNSVVMSRYLEFLSPTLNFQPGDIAKVLFPKECLDLDIHTDACVEIARADWDTYETSWEYSTSPLLTGTKHGSLQSRYDGLRGVWKESVEVLRQYEVENNQAFINTIGLQDDLVPDVATRRVTLECNPLYRYDHDKSESELEALLLADTMREFISYAVGCMLGRYSLDKQGLILANQGETADNYRQQIPEPTFAPDEDNVIPLLDGDWFTDDISERFKEFLKATFGTEHFDENLTFLENALYPDNLTGKKRKTIRDYFLKEFYNHHIKLYKKRPIYWLFSSPKGTFNALIYMHRYRSDTVSVVLNGYLREFQTKLRGKLEQLQHVADIGDATKAEKTKALKTIDTLNKQLKELEEYERDILFPLAQQQIEIDLDDGVKHNYPLFGKALKKVPGLS